MLQIYATCQAFSLGSKAHFSWDKHEGAVHGETAAIWAIHIGAAAGEFEVLLSIVIPQPVEYSTSWGVVLWLYCNYHLLMNRPLRNDISGNFDTRGTRVVQCNSFGIRY